MKYTAPNHFRRLPRKMVSNGKLEGWATDSDDSNEKIESPKKDNQPFTLKAIMGKCKPLQTTQKHHLQSAGNIKLLTSVKITPEKRPNIQLLTSQMKTFDFKNLLQSEPSISYENLLKSYKTRFTNKEKLKPQKLLKRCNLYNLTLNIKQGIKCNNSPKLNFASPNYTANKFNECQSPSSPRLLGSPKQQWNKYRSMSYSKTSINTVQESTFLIDSNSVLWKDLGTIEKAITYLSDYYEISEEFTQSLMLRYLTLEEKTAQKLLSKSVSSNQMICESFLFAKSGQLKCEYVKNYLNFYLPRKGEAQRKCIYDVVIGLSAKIISFNEFIELTLIIKYKNPSNKLAIGFLLKLFEINSCRDISKHEILQKVKFFYLSPLTSKVIKDLARIYCLLDKCFKEESTTHILMVDRAAFRQEIEINKCLCRMLLKAILD